MDQYLGDDTFQHILNTIHAFDIFWQLDHVGPILISSEAHIFGAIRHLNADLNRVRNGVICSGYDPYILQPISTHFNPFRPIGFRLENLWKLDFSDFKQRFPSICRLIVDWIVGILELRDPTESHIVPYILPAQPVKFCEFSIEIATSEKSETFLDVPPEAPAWLTFATFFTMLGFIPLFPWSH